MKNRISAKSFDLPCPACILGRPLISRDEIRPVGVRPQQLEGSWAVCHEGFHALNKKAEDVIRRLKGVA
jgi:hypothetical protein